MPGKITGGEIISDLPVLFDLATTGEAAFNSLPSGPRKADDWRKALGFKDTGLAATSCQTFDELHGGPVTLDEVATLLGIEKGSGFVGKALDFGETLIAQAAS